MRETQSQHIAQILYVGNHAGHFLTHRLPSFCALQLAGYDVHVAVPAASDQLEHFMTSNQEVSELITEYGFHYHRIELSRSSINPFNEFRSLLSLYQLYREIKPDLVFHATIKPIIYGGFISRIVRIPSVVNLISGLGYIFMAQGIKGQILRNAASLSYSIAIRHPNTHTIFQNNDDHRKFLAQNIVRPSTSSVIKGSGVNMETFSMAPEPTGPPVVVLTSRMLWDKGIGEFVKAAEILKRAGVSARFVLIGDTDSANPQSIGRQQLQAWYEKGDIEWWGWRHDISEILKGAHIVCLPSYREGMPKSLIEAAACGRPIVTTDVPGCREIVFDGENGFLVPPRDAEALAEALNKLIQDKELRQRMGSRSREIAEVEFSEKIIGKKITSICTELINSVQHA